MIRNNLKKMIITSVIILLPSLFGFVMWDKLPETMATHFSEDNTPDGFSGKAFIVFGMPLVMLLLHWLCIFATGADTKSKNISPKAISLVLWIVPSLSLLVSALTYGYAFNNEIRIGMIVALFIGVLFIAVGNYMPKAGQNYTYGIKLPWTLSDKKNWNRTHRFAGKIFVLGGTAMLLTAFLENPFIILALAVILSVLPVIYSYVIYLKSK